MRVPPLLLLLLAPCCNTQGNAHGILSGKWNSHVDLTPSKPDGSPADGASARRLWSCAPKPADDAYGCTHFAWKLANTDLLRTPPLASDSRRRGDRHALQERHMVIAAAEKGLIEDEQRIERKVGVPGGCVPGWGLPCPLFSRCSGRPIRAGGCPAAAFVQLLCVRSSSHCLFVAASPLLLQKREQQGDHWSPKFFAPAHDMEVLPGEETPEAVPLWAWNAKYSEAKQQPEVQEWEGGSLACLLVRSIDTLGALQLASACGVHIVVFWESIRLCCCQGLTAPSLHGCCSLQAPCVARASCHGSTAALPWSARPAAAAASRAAGTPPAALSAAQRRRRAPARARAERAAQQS